MPHTSHRKFRAKILAKRGPVPRTGVNPYVDVPARVSRAFAGHGRAGRIRVEGTLDGSPFRATVVPVAGGGHRLYVNGGMRAAAGVDIGDTISVALRPVPEEEPAPRDVAAGLAKVKGARAAFDALPVSRRRELLRHIDDARTPRNRQARIRATAEHVLGKQTQKPSPALRSRPLWICPKCGNPFVNKNSYHACRRYRLSEIFEGKPARVRKLFDRFRKMVEACGPVRMVRYRDRVGFMVRVRFAGATPRKEWLDVGFWLTRPVEHARIRKIETIAPNAHIHRVRITSPDEMDGRLAGWIRQSYRLGRQDRLK